MRRYKSISFLWILGSILVGITLAPLAKAMSPTGVYVFKHPLTTLPGLSGDVPDCEGTVTQPFPPDPEAPATDAPLADTRNYLIALNDLDKAEFSQGCKSQGTAGPLVWLRIHLRGGPFGDGLDPVFNELRSGDGHMVLYWTAISLASKPVGATVHDQLDIRSRIYDQNHGPESLVALLHYRKGTYALLPLNYRSRDTAHAEDVPLGSLSAVYDSQVGKYLLYVPRVNFTTPSWDKSIASWQHYYVWWLDPKKNDIQRKLLPPGPWVSDAKLDIPLARDFRNFSCGTDCYRHAEITRVEGGVIYVTVTGRSSAISSSVLGTYKLSGGTWVKQ